MESTSASSFERFIFSKIEQPVRQHLKNVYACVSLSTLAATAGAYIHMFTNILSGNLLTVLGAIGCLLALHMTGDNGKNQHTRLGLLLGFAFFTGLGLGPILEIAVMVDPSIIVTAFLGTSLIFVCFSASALLADSGKYLALGGILISGMSTIFLLSLANLFFGSYLLFQANLYIGMAIMCGFVLYDTQMIVEKRRRGDKDFIGHSVELFIDFVDIFRRLVMILLSKEQKKNRNNQK